MAEVGPAAGPADVDGSRERGVHGDRRGMEPGHVVGEGLGVVGCDRGAREEAAEQGVPGLGDLVEVKDGPGVSGHELAGGCQDAGAGGGFQDDVAALEIEGGGGDVGKRQRGGELLQLDLVLGPLRVGGFEGGDAFEHGQDARRSVFGGVVDQGGPEVLQEEDGCCLGRFVGLLPEPAPGIVPEDLFHGLA